MKTDFRNATLLLALAAPALPQAPVDLERLLLRLERVEQENAKLQRELAALRDEMRKLQPASQSSPPAAELEERLDIQERRVSEHAQIKLESAHRFPIRLTGMALANVFLNGPHANGLDTPVVASREPGRATGGLTVRQSVLGLEYSGPATFLGGQVRGSIFMDFFDGLSQTSFGPMRMRTAAIELDWKTRGIAFMQEKPLIAIRDPSTFSYAGISPLTGSGNLWRWQPQIRFEQRFSLAEQTVFRAQAAFYQTSEDAGYTAGAIHDLERRRPALQGRFGLEHRWGAGRNVEFAGGFHTSQTHIEGQSLPSRLFMLDWAVTPWRNVQLTGTFFRGKNIHHFGALRQGFVYAGGVYRPVESTGGWAQIAVPLTSRLTWNMFGGIHDDRERDLLSGGIGANRTGAANIQYRIAPNTIVGLEAMQIRTAYVGSGVKLNNRYDLFVAYLF